MTDFVTEIEAATPGWNWLLYRTWRVSGNPSDDARPSMCMATYRATGHRRWYGRPRERHLAFMVGGDE